MPSHAGPLEFIQSLIHVHPRRQLKELYLFLLFFAFSAALITVFEPIFLFKEGFPLWRISLYYALHYVLYAFLLPIGGMFAVRFGYERSLAMSTPLLAVYLLILANLPSWHGLYWVAIVALTVHKMFFWPAYHATFSKYTSSKNRGTEQSLGQLVVVVMGIIGPLAAGFIISTFGFPALFVIAAVMLGLASVPLLRTTERYSVHEFSFQKLWQIIRDPKHRRMVIAMYGWGENLIYLVFWPIAMFLIVPDTRFLGVIVSVAAVGMALFGLFMGELTDRFGSRRVLRFTAPAVALGYVWRIFATTPLGVLLADIYGRAANVGYQNPSLVRLYRSGQKAGPVHYAVAFELVLITGKAALGFALAALFIFVPEAVALPITFGIAGAMALLYAAL